jgi:hypothetical protein
MQHHHLPWAWVQPTGQQRHHQYQMMMMGKALQMKHQWPHPLQQQQRREVRLCELLPWLSVQRREVPL